MSNNIQRLTLQQGSQEWLDLRCKYVTSTLSFKIKDNFTDSAIKQFKGQSGSINQEYADMGHSGEEQCRDYLRSIGHDILPEQATYIDQEKGMLTSIDGESSCKTILYEFKTCKSSESQTYQKASKGIVPTAHEWQIQHSLAVTGHQRCLYVVCLLENGTTGPLDKDSIKFVHVYPDKAMQAKIEERAKEFMEAMKNGTLEVPSNALPENHLEIAKSLISLTGAIEYLKNEKEKLRQQLIEVGPHKANGVQVSKVQGKKKVDFPTALNEIWGDLRQEEQQIIKNSVEKYTTFADDYFRVATNKVVMYANNPK